MLNYLFCSILFLGSLNLGGGGVVESWKFGSEKHPCQRYACIWSHPGFLFICSIFKFMNVKIKQPLRELIWKNVFQGISKTLTCSLCNPTKQNHIDASIKEFIFSTFSRPSSKSWIPLKKVLKDLSKFSVHLFSRNPLNNSEAAVQGCS